jgi:hypothetical protein
MGHWDSSKHPGRRSGRFALVWRLHRTGPGNQIPARLEAWLSGAIRHPPASTRSPGLDEVCRARPKRGHQHGLWRCLPNLSQQAIRGLGARRPRGQDRRGHPSGTATKISSDGVRHLLGELAALRWPRRLMNGRVLGRRALAVGRGVPACSLPLPWSASRASWPSDCHRVHWLAACLRKLQTTAFALAVLI